MDTSSSPATTQYRYTCGDVSVRTLWRDIMFYGDFDRIPPVYWTAWPETLERWYEEGLPRDADACDYFQAVPNWSYVPVKEGLFPVFEEETLEETETYRIRRNGEGVIQKEWKDQSSIPHHIDFIFKDADDWPEFKKRLQPDPARLPDDLDEQIRRVESSGLPIVIPVASMMGWTRNWMGVEGMSYLMYDDPEVYADIVNTLADLSCWTIEQVASRLSGPADLGFGWEDICGKTGPLVSPDIFVELVAPGYTKIRNTLETHGVKLLGIDSDGYVEPLVRHWMDAGVNVFFPIEPGTWGATPEKMRARFGKEMRVIGGFDKFAIEKGPDAIDAEIEAHIGLLREGGFLMEPDHLITPGASLENYRYYIDRIRGLRF